MTGILIDSNVILDLFEEDPDWSDWSEKVLHQYSYTHTMYINPIIYSEVSIGFKRIEELEDALSGCGFELLQTPKEAHAAVDKLELMTRDTLRYKSYFPTVKLISP